MIRKSLICITVGGTLTLAGQFICLPVFAENPIDINIIEVSDDGNGGFRPWEDITDAMPGMTYSVIPRVRNDGALPASVRMCILESVTDYSGNTMMLQTSAFEVDIDEHWKLDGNTKSNALTTGVCYNYSSMLEVGAMTEPLFSGVTLSSGLGNVYKNSTFGLYLRAEATDASIPDAPSPAKPDTGFNTVSYFEIVSPVLISAGSIILFAAVAYTIRCICKK